MAIKVRHDGNAAATAAAGLGSGRAKRRIETAKLAQNTPQHIQTLGAAHASAPGAGGGSAPLTHAPTGASGASAPLTHAPSPTVGGGGAGSRSSSLRGSGAPGDYEYKVTGTSIFDRPDKDSQWNPATMRWERPWLPGEKEAEAAQRMNPVLAEREQFRHGLADESAAAKAQQERELFDYKLTQKQKMELAAINDALEEARKSGRYTPEEMAELEQQALVRRAGIKPLPTPREKDAQKAFDERIVTAGGIQGYINSKGDFEPFQNPNAKNEKRLTLNDVLKNVPMRELDPTDKTGLKEIDIPIDRRLDTAQKILDRIYPPQSASTEASGIDPVIQRTIDPLGMSFPQGAEQPPVGPYAPPPPPTPEETRKKWSAFKAQ